MQASVHADEMPGMFCVHHLTPLLRRADEQGMINAEIIVVPFANPIGLAQEQSGQHHGRFDFASRENFNRGYPWLAPHVHQKLRGRLSSDARANVALVRQSALECLEEQSWTTEFDSLRIALMKLAVDSDYCFDLHSAGEAMLYLYCDTDPGDETITELAAQMQSHATFVQTDMGAARPFSSSVGQIWHFLAALVDDPDCPIPSGCFSATIELRGGRAIEDETTEHDAEHLFRFLQRRGVIGGDPGPLPKLLYRPQPISACDHGYAPKTGILVHTKALGAQVEEGEVVAVIVDPSVEDFEAARTPVEAGASGTLFDRQGDRFARKGDVLFRIAADAPLPHREGRTALDD